MVDIALKYIKINQIIQDNEQHKNYPKESIMVGRKKKTHQPRMSVTC